MKDEILQCEEKGCGRMFTFSVNDQQFFARQGWPKPIRCKEHRAAKKKRWEARNGKEVMAKLEKGEKVTLDGYGR